MGTCTCYYVDLTDDFSWLIFCLYVGYKHGSMMCSSYGYCSQFDKYLNGWLIHGITSVFATTWEGIIPSWWFSNEV